MACSFQQPGTAESNQPETGKQSPVRAGSLPGGMARQFRVQLLDSGLGQWRLYATFRTRSEATRCLADLLAAGQPARLMDCPYPATAA